MKSPIFVVSVLIVVGVVWTALFKGGDSRHNSSKFGNLSMTYAWEERGILPTKVKWLIVSPEMPRQRTYHYDGGIVFEYEGGNEYSFQADSDNIIWVSRESGPEIIKAALNMSLIEKIEALKDDSKYAEFRSPQEFLTRLQQF